MRGCSTRQDAFDPAGVGFLGAKRIALAAQEGAETVEQAGVVHAADIRPTSRCVLHRAGGYSGYRAA